MNNKGKIAITEILILVIGIIAVIYSIGVVSSYVEPPPLGYDPYSGTVIQLPFTPNPVYEYEAKTISSKLLGVETITADAIISGLQWGLVAYLAVQFLGPLFGLDKDTTNALSYAAAAGFGVGKALYVGEVVSSAWTAGLIGLAIAAVVYAAFYKETSYKLIRVSCNAWDAEVGGDYCEKCNEQELPCSEYQCKSLGQACELVNKGTDDEFCVAVDIDDPNPPTISPWENPLTQGYEYTPENTINPPDRGVRIINTDPNVQDQCVKAFTPLKFGVTLDKPGRCRIDSVRGNNYSDMVLEISNGLKLYNHTIQLELPGMSNFEQQGITIQNDGEFELYVRCEDANGNSNLASFVFKYCVEKGPDYTAPEVVNANVLNNFPVAFGQETLDFELYTNEPADCKWGFEDRDYEDLPNKMNCPVDRFEDGTVINARTVYPCTTTLTGIQDRQENKFYFKCKDQPLLEGTNRSGDRNTNSESYIHTIIGTQPLVIDDAGPNGTIRDSSIAVKTTLTSKTSAGYNEGEATCSFSEVGENRFIQFFNTNSHTHSTDLFLEEGDYEYIIKCIDLGGNEDTWQVNFTTESDTEAPEVVRAYKEDNFLKVVTDEDGECVYDTTNCNYLFDDGLPMDGNEKDHFTTWDTTIEFYIKCRDEYGNEPAPDECNIIISPIE